MNIKRITPPMFKVDNILINEYELRQLMVDVKKGLQPANITVCDMAGNETTINEKGFLVGELEGLDIMGNLSVSLLTIG
jgi:hypothetical protein